MFFKHLPNPNQTIFNYPYTRKAKIQQRSISQDISLNVPQQFVTTSTLLPNQHSRSTPEDMSLLNNDMVKI